MSRSTTAGSSSSARCACRALHTPGHRPEHTAFALIDTARSERPWAVLTGDTLFVNDVARPDLAIEKADGARGIFHSLRDKLMTLPPECEVWPGHLGGSMCGGPAMDMKISSTIGYERASNPTLAIEDEDAFVEEALAGLGPQPPNFENIVALNRGELLTVGVEVLPLAPRQVETKRAGGALLVDVRTDQQFDDAHIGGAVCNPMMTAGFGSKLAWLGDPELEIVFVGRDDEDGRRAARLALSVGLRRLGGFLHGGMTSWRQEKRPIERVERMPLEELPKHAEHVQILDVREQLGVGRGPHPRLRLQALARHRRAARRPRPGAADRRRLRLRPARRGGGEPRPARGRARSDPRGRRRRPQVGPPGQRARDG